MSALLERPVGLRPEPEGSGGAGDPAGPTIGDPSRRPTVRERLFAPGWPIAWLLVGYPIWWILGVAEAATYIFSAIMAVALVRRGTIATPRGFGLWLVFLGFTVIGVSVLQVDAPGAEPGTSNGRYLVWAFRLVWYLCGTVMMLYVANMRDVLTLKRVSRIFSWMFVVVVVGGVLGALFPYVSFPSALELILPKSITNVGFVQQLIHPTLAQIQSVLGYVEARPSAPFSFTNTWGLAIACFLPFFVVSWFAKDAGWHRIVGPFVLLAALAPIVQSLNRGLWGAIVGMAVFVALRYALMGRMKLLATMLVSFALVTGVVLATPLADTIALRWANQHSNEGRTNLGTATVTSTLQASPVVGYGTTRQVQGSFNSISGGNTAECPHCSPPSLGTQGQAWLLTFTGGLGALISWIAFFGYAFFRAIRLRSPYATAALCVLLAHAITSIVYNVNGPGLLAILVAVAFLWRESGEPEPRLTPGGARRGDVPVRTVGHYLLMLRRHAAVFIVLGLLGAAAGVALVVAQGVPYRSTISLTVDDEPAAVLDQAPLTLDSEAQYVGAPQVLAAVTRATGLPVTADDLLVSATANSRVLHIDWQAPTAAKAEAGVRAAAEAFLEMRTARLTTERAAAVRTLQLKADTARDVLLSSQARLAQARLLPSGVEYPTPLRLLSGDIDRQVTDLGRLTVQLTHATNQSVQAGAILLTPPAQEDQDVPLIAAVSGVALAMLLAALVVLVNERVSPRAWRARTITRRTGLPVVASLSADRPGPIPGLRPLAQSLVSRGARASLASGTSAGSRAVAHALDRSIAFEADQRDGVAPGVGPERPGVVITVDRRTRTREVVLLRDAVEAAGSMAIGVVQVTAGPSSRTGVFRKHGHQS